MASRSRDGEGTKIQHDKLANLQAFWQAQCGERPWPPWRRFPPEALWTWFGHLVVLAVEPDPRRYWVKLYGTQVVDYSGSDFTHRYLDEVLSEAAADRTLAPLDRCVELGRPVYELFASALPGATVRRLHRLVLPFGARSSQVEVLLEGVYVEGWRYAGEFRIADLYAAGRLP